MYEMRNHSPVHRKGKHHHPASRLNFQKVPLQLLYSWSYEQWDSQSKRAQDTISEMGGGGGDDGTGQRRGQKRRCPPPLRPALPCVGSRWSTLPCPWHSPTQEKTLEKTRPRTQGNASTAGVGGTHAQKHSARGGEGGPARLPGWRGPGGQRPAPPPACSTAPAARRRPPPPPRRWPSPRCRLPRPG